MYASITKKGYTFTNPEFDEEMEAYLKSIPFVQRQGVKGMLDFFRLHTKDGVTKFVKDNFSMKPTKNVVINAIHKYMATPEYQKDLQAFRLYIKSKNFYPPQEYKSLKRLQEHVTTGLKVNEKFFKRRRITSEEELELVVSLALFKRDDLELKDNFINTALNNI